MSSSFAKLKAKSSSELKSSKSSLASSNFDSIISQTSAQNTSQSQSTSSASATAAAAAAALASKEIRYACVLCFGRFRFEELTSDLMLCKPCSQILVLVKCHHCRLEFERNTKLNKQKPILCDQCAELKKAHGDPRPCDYCQLVAAFGKGETKCSRCLESEKKYGPPGICEQCKRKCSFTGNNNPARDKVGGQMLCWHCTASYKRVMSKLANNNNTNSTNNLSSTSNSKALKSSSSSNPSSSNHKSKSSTNQSSNASTNSLPGKPATSARPVQSASLQNFTLSSDKVAEVAQLREKILSLEKQLESKNQDAFLKDTQIEKLEAEIEREQASGRDQIQELQRKNNERIFDLQQKIDTLVTQMSTIIKKK